MANYLVAQKVLKFVYPKRELFETAKFHKLANVGQNRYIYWNI